MHGDESGSVDPEHNLAGSRLIEADPKRVLVERQRMDQQPYDMDRSRREAVLAALLERFRIVTGIYSQHMYVLIMYTLWWTGMRGLRESRMI
jgi:hypothetical protein